MVIDVNAGVGNWAFRNLKYETAESLLYLMDKLGIDKSIVSSINSILYRNTRSGNEELYGQIKKYRDRFIHFSVINPKYPGWKKDLHYCIQEFNTKGIKIYPNYHGYRVTDNEVSELLKEAEEYNLPVSMTLFIEDTRQRHFLDSVSQLTKGEFAELIHKFPNINFIITNVNFTIAERLIYMLPEHRNFYFDTSWLWGPPSNELQLIIDKIGTERVLFGTHMPFRYPEVAFLKVECLGITSEEKGNIFYKNILRILK